jgi:hypothetical protein
MTFCNRIISAASRASGPGDAWTTRPLGPGDAIRPCAGFDPYSPHRALGIRIEPPMSEPIASVATPAANAAAEPPDDPPGVHSKFHGLRVTPQRILQVTPIKNSSGAVVCACRTAPAASSLSITG